MCSGIQGCFVWDMSHTREFVGAVCLMFVVPEFQHNGNVAVFLFPLIKDSEGVPPSKKMKVEASQQNVEEI